MSAVSQWVRTKSDEAAVDAGCTFDITRADRVRRFFSKYLRHSKGAFANKPFELIPWQWEDVIAPAFGWIMPDGTRRFRHVILFVPKKNGKSTILAGVTLYMLCADGEEGAEVYSAAADRDQASIIYNEAANMVDASPALQQLLKVRRSVKLIKAPHTKGQYKALSADAHTKEGFNIHGLLFDETHSQPDSTLWDTLKYGGAARTQPMFWRISTAGIQDDAAFWWTEWQYAKALQRGDIVDIATLGVVYGADPGDDWTSEETWRKANPSYGLTLNTRDFADECKRAQANAADESQFKRYRLNVPVTKSSGWLRSEFWEACKVQEAPKTKPLRCIYGLDLAATTDVCALARVYQYPDHLYVEPHFWVPQLKVDDRERSNRQKFKKWVDDGYITATPTAYTDYGVLHDDIVRYTKEDRPAELAIDAWNFTQLAVNLNQTFKDKRLKTRLVPVRSGFLSISAATKELERLILSGRIRFTPNPVLDWMFTNVAIEQDASGNRKPTKEKSADKIDGIVAMILAIARYLAIEEKGKSVYETRGLQFITT